jgi:hypothetical protein
MACPLTSQEVAIAKQRIDQIFGECMRQLEYSPLTIPGKYLRYGRTFDVDDLLYGGTDYVGQAHRVITRINNDTVLNDLGNHFKLSYFGSNFPNFRLPRHHDKGWRSCCRKNPVH